MSATGGKKSVQFEFASPFKCENLHTKAIEETVHFVQTGIQTHIQKRARAWLGGSTTFIDFRARNPRAA